MLSDSFMDALEEQAPKKPKIVRKKLNPLSSQASTSTGPVVFFMNFKIL